MVVKKNKTFKIKTFLQSLFKKRLCFFFIQPTSNKQVPPQGSQ